jgi:prevent-host-death family protein
MATATTSIDSRTVTSKDAQRKWKEVTDRALREPVVITAHGRPRHVLMAYDDYNRLRKHARQVYTISDIPPDLAADILANLDNLRAPLGTPNDGDTIID